MEPHLEGRYSDRPVSTSKELDLRDMTTPSPAAAEGRPREPPDLRLSSAVLLEVRPKSPSGALAALSGLRYRSHWSCVSVTFRRMKVSLSTSSSSAWREEVRPIAEGTGDESAQS